MALTTNLAAYWKLNESSGNAADSSGSSTLTNYGTATYAAGKVNNGVSLASASTQYLACADNVALSITGDLSISAWVKPATAPSESRMTIASKFEASGTTNQRSWWLQYRETGGTKMIEMSVSADGSTRDVVTINVDLGTGVWKHIVWTYTAATSKYNLYIDGTATGGEQTGTRTSIYDSTADFALGVYNDAADKAGLFNGMIDEVGVWSRVLSSTEVAALYNSGNALPYPFNGIIKKIAGIWKAVTLFSDNFARADSTTIGNGWTKGLNGSGVDVAIVSEQLDWSSKSTGGNTLWHDQGGIKIGVGGYIKLKLITGTTKFDSLTYKMNGDGATNYGFGIIVSPLNNTIGIKDSSTTKVTDSYTFATSTTYYLEFLRTTNGGELRIWTTTRPATATLAFDNGSAYTPTSANAGVYLTIDSWSNNGTTIHEYMDDIVCGYGADRSIKKIASISKP